MPSVHPWFVPAVSVLLGACGVTVHQAGAGGSASTGGSGGSATTGAGGAADGGDCATDADCPDGSCIELTPGGYKVCAHFAPEAMACNVPPGPMTDQCCKSADCTMGKCYRSTDIPACGGPPFPAYNQCLEDQCETDAACVQNGMDPRICIPAGAFGVPVRVCFTAYCKTHADCTAHAGGRCATIKNPCCRPFGLACVYPGGCAQDSDCGANAHCTLDAASGAGACTPGIVTCAG